MKLNAILDNKTLLLQISEAPLGICITDHEGVILYANQALWKIFDLTEETITGIRMEHLVEYTGEPPWTHKKNEKEITWEEVKGKINSTKGLFLLGCLNSFRSREGIKLFLHYFIDISPHLHIEGKLENSNGHLHMERDLYQAGPVIVFNWKAEEDWPVEYVSENIAQLGYNAGDFTKGKISFIEIIYPKDRQRIVNEVIQYSQEGRQSFEQTYRIQKKDDTRIWVYDYTTIIRDQDGKITNYLGYILDMTEMKYLESALRDREEKFRLISENMQDLICLHDPDGTLSYISPSVRDLLGYEPEDLLGTSPAELYHPDDLNRIKREVLEPANAGASNMRIQYRMRKADGTYTWFETLTTPILDDSRKVIKLQTASRDISRQKLMEQQVQSLVKFPEENPHPVIRASKKGEIIYANRASDPLIRYWNCKDGRYLPDYWIEFIEGVLNSGKSREIEISIIDRIYLFSITPIPEDKETYIYGIDITEKQRQEKELHLTAQIFETTLEGISVTDTNGTIQSVNPAFSRITGYSAEEVQGKNPRILKSDRHDADFYTSMWQSITEKGSWEGEIWNRRKSGETYPEWLSINAIHDDIGQVQNYVAVFTDITEIKTKEEKIEYQAFHDPLTELPNRNLLNDRLEIAIARSSRSGKRLALVFIDLDRFKIINDSLGHITGDYLLIEVSKRLQTCIRDEDTIARIGGDEFVILLSEIDDINDITTVTDRIIETFSEPVIIDMHELFVTPSIGISLYPDDGTTAPEIFKNADIAMYESKKSGGNRYHFYADQMNEGITERLRLESNLHRAVKGNEFDIHYQPLVELKGGRIVGAEALIRWHTEALGNIPPDEFIPLAEEMGLIVQINEFMIRQACQNIADVHDLDLSEMYISINITAQQFYRAKIIETIKTTLASSGLKPKHITIEITENTLMENVEETILVMKEIQEMGIRFSIDDFGTGYSSLSYLRRFPLDNLKIDKSFVDELPHNEESAAIARTIITLGRSLNLKIVAEGVETPEQLKFLRDEGVDFIQGFYFSRPLPLDQFIELIKKGPFPQEML